MTITIDYVPEVYPVNTVYYGVPAYWFLMESIGLEAIEVYEVDEAADTKTLVDIADYYINFGGVAPLYDGGILVMNRQHPANITHVRLERNTRITQLVDFYRVGIFHPQTLEFVLDKATMICQEISARKCKDTIEGVPETIAISQLIDFYPGGPFEAATLEYAVQKLIDIIIEIEAASEDCRDNIGAT